jgi:hypothetical protein
MRCGATICSARIDPFHPGEGRGPVGKALVIERRTWLCAFRDWTPAFAGEALKQNAGVISMTGPVA